MMRSTSQQAQQRILHANCPYCRIPNQLVVPNSSGHFAFQCGLCAQPFRIRRSLPPVRDISFCHICGSMNTHLLPGMGMPFPSISCRVCGHVLRLQGAVSEREPQTAELLERSMDGPNTFMVTTLRDLRQAVPSRFLRAAVVRPEAEGSPQLRHAALGTDIAALPVQKVDNVTHLREQACCTICLEKFKNGDEVKTLPCLHMFHSGEIDLWLKHNNSCPICKTPVGLATQRNFCSYNSK